MRAIVGRAWMFMTENLYDDQGDERTMYTLLDFAQNSTYSNADGFGQAYVPGS